MQEQQTVNVHSKEHSGCLNLEKNFIDKTSIYVKLERETT